MKDRPRPRPATARTALVAVLAALPVHPGSSAAADPCPAGSPDAPAPVRAERLAERARCLHNRQAARLDAAADHRRLQAAARTHGDAVHRRRQAAAAFHRRVADTHRRHPDAFLADPAAVAGALLRLHADAAIHAPPRAVPDPGPDLERAAAIAAATDAEALAALQPAPTTMIGGQPFHLHGAPAPVSADALRTAVTALRRHLGAPADATGPVRPPPAPPRAADPATVVIDHPERLGLRYLPPALACWIGPGCTDGRPSPDPREWRAAARHEALHACHAGPAAGSRAPLRCPHPRHPELARPGPDPGPPGAAADPDARPDPVAVAAAALALAAGSDHPAARRAACTAGNVRRCHGTGHHLPPTTIGPPPPCAAACGRLHKPPDGP